MNTIKIITAFHGSVIHSNAFSDPDFYIPVYGGRSVTPYLPDQSKKMLADNTGDNISWMNPYIGELSCIYWASKHLDELGNPDYIGLNHYRRLFPIRKYFETLQKCEKPFIVTSMRNVGMPILTFSELEYGIEDDVHDLLIDITKTKEELTCLANFFSQRLHDYAEKNLFIIPTSELDGYINFIMKAIHVLYRDFKFDYLNGMPYRRRTARILEFVTAFYLFMLGSKLQHFVMKYEYPWRSFS